MLVVAVVGLICVAQRDNALRFPHALFKKKLALDEYMNARSISDPIHLFDCVMPCAGAEAFLVCSAADANALAARKRDAVSAAQASVLRPVGECNVFSCSDW